MLICRICGGEAALHFHAKVLGKHDGDFRYCAACDYIFAEDPHWLNEAYTDAIVKSDTDIAVRNVLTALRLAAILHFAFDDHGKGIYADVAGGYGLLTRLMRDLGFDYFWTDPYANNLFSRGFEYSSSNGDCSAISAIEVLEHTTNPLDFLSSSLSAHGTDTILFTTMTFPNNCPPAASEWDYYSLETGQHISFFSRKGLQTLGQRLGMEYYQLGRIHLLTRRKLSRMHISILSHRLLTVPLALAAARSLGSRRGRDRAMLLKRPTF